jgi:hypothetical protein
VSANKTGAWQIKRRSLTSKIAIYVRLRSITRGRARGPPTALSQQSGLVRRVLGTHASWPAYAAGDQGAARLAGSNTSVASGCERDTSTATWLHPVAAGRQWTAVPPSAHAGFLQRASSFHLIGRFPQRPGLLTAVKAFAWVNDTPIHQR